MASPYHIAFIIEQALGHITHAQNLKVHLERDAELAPHWGFPAYDVTGLAEKLPLYRSNWTVRAGLRTRRLLAGMARQGKLEALFFHTQVTAVLAGDWLRRLPAVISLDATPQQYDELGDFYAHTRGPAWLERLKWRLNRDAFQRARRLVTWSEWAKTGLVQGYGVPAEKVYVIPPGVDTHAWQPPRNSRNGRTANGQALRILFVGGDLERKGGLELLVAFRELRVSNPHLELHLVTRQQVSAQPGVKVYNDMQPNSPALRNLYFTSDIFCLPSRGDCLPVALAEAGAANLPLVSTQVAAIPELVRSGETGFAIPPGDRDALGQALSRLVENEDLRRSLGLAAAERARKHFDAACNAERLATLLKEVVETERRRKLRDE
ncbi:MAG: glycosyltransferase family 4 protein [Anaerolineales bacterium]